MYVRGVGAALAGALVLLGTVATDVAAQRRDRDDDRRGGRDRDERGDRDWAELGCQNVSFQVDRDTVRVGVDKGRFRAIRIYARGADVEMLDLDVVYGNGERDDLPVRSVLKRGERTRPIDLRGADRAIDRVVMKYRAVPNFRGREAEVCIEGLVAHVAPPPPPSREWVELGCQQVSLFGKDRDSIRVGRREGRFKALRLHVRGADVEMLDLKVIYGNGEPDDIRVRHFIRAGEHTRPMDLKGWERSIDRIDLTYRSAANPVDIIARQRISQATVCAEGLQ